MEKRADLDNIGLHFILLHKLETDFAIQTFNVTRLC